MNPLRQHQQQLERICKLLKDADGAKSLFERSQSLSEMQGLLPAIQWDLFKLAVTHNADATATELEAGVRNRRENLLARLNSLGLPFQRHGEYDRVGPIRTYYERNKVILKVGSSLERARLHEVEAGKLADWIKANFEQATAPMSDYPAFAELLRIGFDQARIAGQTKTDGWLSLRRLYREVWLARSRDAFSGRGMKPPTPKDYQLVDFVLDLAKWLQGERLIPGAKLKLRPPAMGQNEDALIIPSVVAPWGEELTNEAKLESAS